METDVKSDKRNFLEKISLKAFSLGLVVTLICFSLYSLIAGSFLPTGNAQLYSVNIPFTVTVKNAPQAPEQKESKETKIAKPLPRSADEDMSVKPVAVPTLAPKTRGIFSLVVMDYGLSKRQSEIVHQRFPQYTTFAVSPYANLSNVNIEVATKNKHEIWGYAPISEENGIYTGPLDIIPQLPIEQRIKRVQRLAQLYTNYVGALTYGDGTTQSFLTQTFEKQQIPYSYINDTAIPSLYFNRFDLLLDDKEKLRDFLNAVFSNKRRGVIFIEPNASLIDDVSKLLESFESANLQIVPLSYLMRN